MQLLKLRARVFSHGCGFVKSVFPVVEDVVGFGVVFFGLGWDLFYEEV